MTVEVTEEGKRRGLTPRGVPYEALPQPFAAIEAFQEYLRTEMRKPPKRIPESETIEELDMLISRVETTKSRLEDFGRKYPWTHIEALKYLDEDVEFLGTTISRMYGLRERIKELI